MKVPDGNRRGVSEAASVAALVALTVVVTASVGLGVLFIDSSDDGMGASVTFQHFPERGAMLITYEEGPELAADSVVVRGSANEVTWATLRGLNESATIAPGARAQLNRNNRYGNRVTQTDTVTVVYVEGENETVLGEWEGGG